MQWISSFVIVGMVAGFGGAASAERTGVPGVYPEALHPAARKLPLLEVSEGLLEPSVRGLLRGAFFAVNRAGFRGAWYPLKRPPGSLRIAVVGGAATLGVGVWQGEEFPALMQTHLNAARPTQLAEVLNFGGVCDGARGACSKRVETLLARFAPRVIVASVEGSGPYAGPDFQEVLSLGVRQGLCTVAFVLPVRGQDGTSSRSPTDIEFESPAVHSLDAGGAFEGTEPDAVWLPDGLPTALGHRELARVLYRGLVDLSSVCPSAPPRSEASKPDASGEPTKEPSP